MLKFKTLLAIAGLTLAAATPALAVASTFPEPDRPIDLIVGFPPGGGADVLARTVAPRLAAELNAKIIVENKPGASGIIATAYTSHAKNDGYTLYLATPGSLTILPNLQKVPYDPANFSAISLLVTMPNVLVTGTKSRIHSVRDLISLAKSTDVTYASGGNGTIGQMAGEQFNMLANIHMRHIPYRGTTPALTDVAGGLVDVTFSDPSTKSLVDGGKLRALAVTSKKRSSQFPGVPTIAEAGLPEYELLNWYGVIGPANLPPAVVKRVNAAFVKIMAEPAVVKQLAAQGGMDATSSTPEEFARLMQLERTKWKALIEKAHISLN